MDSIESVVKLLVDSMVDGKENIDDNLLASYHSGDAVMIFLCFINSVTLVQPIKNGIQITFEVNSLFISFIQFLCAGYSQPL